MSQSPTPLQRPRSEDLAAAIPAPTPTMSDGNGDSAPDSAIGFSAGVLLPGIQGIPAAPLEIATPSAALRQAERECDRVTAALQRSQREQSVIFDAVPAMIWYKDRHNRILRANRLAAESIGLRVEEVAGTPTGDLYPEEADGYHLDDQEVIATGRPKLGILEQLRTAGGEKRWVQTDKIPYREESGEIVGVIAFAVDVTERLRAEQALQERLRFERLITSISARFINLDHEHVDDAIGDAVRELGEFSGVNSSFVYLSGSTETAAQLTRAWYGGELALSAADAETLADRPGGWAAGQLADQGYLNVPRVEDLGTDAAAERELLRAADVRSLLMVPLLFGGARRGMLGFCSRQAEKHWTEDNIALLRIAAEIFAGTLQRRQAEQALRASERRYRLLFERNLAGVFRNSTEGVTLDCNDAYAKILGFSSRHQCIGTSVAGLYVDHRQRESVIQRVREQGSLSNEEIALRRSDGATVWVLANLTWLDRRDGEPAMIEGTLVDITQRKIAESRIVYQAYHDALTDLPNRLLFQDRLAQALAQARRHGHGLAVLFMDLDQFKLVNDTLGHHAGDRLLQLVAERLTRTVRAEDTVARVGGDEFAILLPHIARSDDAARVAQHLLAAVSVASEIENQRIFITTSIGISIFPTDGCDAEELLTGADIAMYRAKDLGRNGYQLCTPAMTTKAMVRLTLEQELRLALERDELTLFYQPQLDLVAGRVVGFEALLRWHHPLGEIIAPDRFITVAEEARLIVPIGEWVIATACRQMRDWQLRLLGAQRIAVNLSPRQFEQEDLLRRVAAILEETGLAPSCLTLEITESAAMQNIERTVEVVAALREMGIHIAIDDFGTGHASLTYLQQFAIDALKIDRAFVAGLATIRSSRAIVNAIIDLAHGLDLEVVAEGVETEEQLGFLAARSCDAYQGYLASPPVAAAAAEQFLRLPRWR